MKTLGFLILLFLIINLVSCQPQPAKVVSPGDTTPTPTPSLPTTAPDLTPPSLPSSTPSSAFLQASPATTATPEILAANPNVVQTLVAGRTSVMLSTIPSPDGRWRAEVSQYPCLAVSPTEGMVYEQLKLISQDGKQKKVVEDQVFLCEGLGAYGLGGLYWSPNSRYLYYSPASQGVPDGLVCYWDRPVNRVDVETGKIDRLTEGLLSPDETSMMMRQGRELILWSLDQGEVARMQTPASGAQVGDMAWSPDGKVLMYLATASDCPPFGRSTLVRVDLPDLKQTILMESELPGFTSLSWEAARIITLFDDKGGQWEFNLDTSALSQVK